MPNHGDERNHHDVTTAGNNIALVTPNGRTVYDGPMSFCTRTRKERYCAVCELWLEVEGVTGMLSWIAVHDFHERDAA